MKPKEYKLKDKHLEYFSVSVFHIQIEIASTSADYFRRGMSSKHFFIPPRSRIKQNYSAIPHSRNKHAKKGNGKRQGQR